MVPNSPEDTSKEERDRWQERVLYMSRRVDYVLQSMEINTEYDEEVSSPSTNNRYFQTVWYTVSSYRILFLLNKF